MGGKSKGKGSRARGSCNVRHNWAALQAELQARHRRVGRDTPVDPYSGKQEKLNNPSIGRLVLNGEDFIPCTTYLHKDLSIAPSEVPLSMAYMTKTDLDKHRIADQATILQRAVTLLDRTDARPADDLDFPVNDIGVVWKREQVDVFVRIKSDELAHECRVLYEAAERQIPDLRSRTIIYLGRLVVDPKVSDNSFIKDMNALLPSTVTLSGMTLLYA